MCVGPRSGKSPGEEGRGGGAGVWHAHFLGPYEPHQGLSIPEITWSHFLAKLDAPASSQLRISTGGGLGIHIFKNFLDVILVCELG